MIWDRPDHKLALAVLLLERSLSRNAALGPVIDLLLEAGWVRQTPRRKVVELTALGEREARALLQAHWPDWEAATRSLREAGFPLTATGLSQRERERRYAKLEAGELPARVNQRTLAARLERHSKAISAGDLQQHWPQVNITTDDVLRLRAPVGMQLRHSDGRCLSADDVMAICGELVLPERALLDGIRLEGVWKAVLTVENPGAYVDLALPPGWLAVLIPGWNSNLALRLLATVPSNVLLVHFGDLDPEGWAIVQHLRRSLGRPINWFVPAFWTEYLEQHGLELPEGRRWPTMEEGLVPPLVQTLARSGRWLEQEVIVLDPRLERAIEAER